MGEDVAKLGACAWLPGVELGEDAAKLGACAWLSCDDGATTRLGAWLSCDGATCPTGAWLSCGGNTAGLGCGSWSACATGA